MRTKDPRDNFLDMAGWPFISYLVSCKYDMYVDMKWQLIQCIPNTTFCWTFHMGAVESRVDSAGINDSIDSLSMDQLQNEKPPALNGS